MAVTVRLPRLLNPDGTERARLRPTAYSLQLMLEGVSTAQLTLTEADADVAMHDLVELYTAAGSAGLFRVTNIQRTYARDRVITLLHGIDTLSDGVWKAQADYTGTVAGFLSTLLGHQPAARWQLGVCEDTGVYKRSGLNYDRLSDLLQELLTDREGYYPEYDFSTTPWTLSLRALPSAPSCEFRLSRNVRGCQINRSDADQCTRLYLSVSTTEDKTIPGYDPEDLPPDRDLPVITSGSVKVTETNVTVYDNAAAQAAYGIIEKTADINAEDVADPAAWAARFLRDRAEPAVQITIDGDELTALTGEAWDALSLGRLCRAALAEYGETYTERVMAVTYPDALGDPTHVTVELANRLPKFSAAIGTVKAQTAAATATAKKASRGGGSSTKDQEHWAMVVQKAVEAMDGTGLTQLYESGITMDAEQGVKIYSLGQGLTSEHAEIAVQRNRISLVVEGSGEDAVIKTASIVTAINDSGSNVIINADKIDLRGYVTMDSFQSVQGYVQALSTGTGQAVKLWSGEASINKLDIGSASTGSMSYQGKTISTGNALSADGTELRPVMVLGSGPFASSGLSALSGAFNGATASEDDGVITFTFSLLGGGTPVTASFNMADTKFYQDAVSAAGSGVTLSGAWDNYSGTSVGYTVTASNNKTNTVNMALALNQAGDEVNLMSGGLIRASLPIQSVTPSGATVTACYVSSWRITAVTGPKASSGLYNVTSEVYITVEYSDGTSTLYGPYTRTHTDVP